MERQAALYEAQREQLLQIHPEQYVLFGDGKVLDADTDFETLILRIFAEIGPREVFIQQVGIEAATPVMRTSLLTNRILNTLR